MSNFQVNFRLDRFFKEMAKEERRIPRIERRALQIVTKRLYEKIFSKWPKDTWWSGANHHIQMGLIGNVPVEPPEKPTVREGALGPAFKNRNEQLQKLRTLAPTVEKLYIANAVPYADDVGFDEGAGERIYEEAADQVSATVQAELDSMFGSS